MNEKDYGTKSCLIKEDLGEAQKETYYYGKTGNELSQVMYTKGNIEKRLNYDNDKPTGYWESDSSPDNGHNIMRVDYAPNGDIYNVYYEHYDDIIN